MGAGPHLVIRFLTLRDPCPRSALLLFQCQGIFLTTRNVSLSDHHWMNTSLLSFVGQTPRHPFPFFPTQLCGQF